MASTDTWKVGVSGDWFNSSNWLNKAPPASKDVAILTSSSTSSAYTVTVSTSESVTVNTVNVTADNAGAGPITLVIDGSDSISTLEYDPSTVVASNLTVHGTLTINKAITNVAGVNETIGVAGGTLNLESKNADNSNLTINFNNSRNGTLDLGYNGLKSINTSIVGFTYGDRIIASNLNLTGDTYTYNGKTLTIKSGTTKVLSVSLQGLPRSAQFNLSGSSIEAVVCYVAGTHIATPTGEERVENLRVGNLVTTVCDGKHIASPVKWIGYRRISLASHLQHSKIVPVRIQAGAFADDVPHRDLLVSPDHAIFVDDKLVCARQLINNMTIFQDTAFTSVTYFHIELDAHAILLAEGLTAESYLNTGNNGFFVNRVSPVSLYADRVEEMDYPTRQAGSVAPFVWEETDVFPVWNALAERAMSLGGDYPKFEVTRDAEVCLEANGRLLKPIQIDSDAYSFVIPANTAFVRLISHANAPIETKPWLEDSRVLGVYVRRITICDPSNADMWDIPLDHPSLFGGWHDIEQDGMAQRRWTDGNALVALEARNQALLLTVFANSADLSYVSFPRGGFAKEPTTSGGDDGRQTDPTAVHGGSQGAGGSARSGRARPFRRSHGAGAEHWSAQHVAHLASRGRIGRSSGPTQG